jgi:hypothetical protein
MPPVGGAARGADQRSVIEHDVVAVDEGKLIGWKVILSGCDTGIFFPRNINVRPGREISKIVR